MLVLLQVWLDSTGYSLQHIYNHVECFINFKEFMSLFHQYMYIVLQKYITVSVGQIIVINMDGMFLYLTNQLSTHTHECTHILIILYTEMHRSLQY